jgi:hypothetical protein
MPTATRCCPAPACRLQVADPKYGEWLDVYLTILAPLPTPVGGMLGEPPVHSPALPRCPPAGLLWLGLNVKPAPAQLRQLLTVRHQSAPASLPPCSHCVLGHDPALTLCLLLLCSLFPHPAGSSYRPPPNGGVMTSSSGEAPFAALVWEQEVM